MEPEMTEQPARKRVRFTEEVTVTEVPRYEEDDEEQDTEEAPSGACKLDGLGEGDAQCKVGTEECVVRATGTPFLDSILDAEEEEPEELYNDAGIPIEPFHLRQEREEGFFDADGSYVRYRLQEDEQDDWLDSLPRGRAEVDMQLAAAVRSRSEAMAAAAGGNLDASVARMYRLQLAELLRPGESVLDALKRLGGTQRGAAGGRGGRGRGNGRRRDAAAERERWDRELSERMRSGRMVPPDNRAAFNTLTELSDALLGDGDMRIYTDSREQLLRRTQGAAAPAAPAAAPTAHAGPPAADPQQDIFADMDDDTPAASADVDADSSQQAASQAATDAAAVTPAPAHGAEPARFSTSDAMHIDATTTSVDHNNASAAPAGAASAGDEGREAAAAEAAGSGGPLGGVEGYELDKDSGLYYSSAKGLYFDPDNQLYGDATTGHWFVLQDGQRQRVY